MKTKLLCPMHRLGLKIVERERRHFGMDCTRKSGCTLQPGHRGNCEVAT